MKSSCVRVDVDIGHEWIVLTLTNVVNSATGEADDIRFSLTFLEWDRIMAGVQRVRAEHEAALPVMAELLGALEAEKGESGDPEA